MCPNLAKFGKLWQKFGKISQKLAKCCHFGAILVTLELIPGKDSTDTDEGHDYTIL